MEDWGGPRETRSTQVWQANFCSFPLFEFWILKFI